MASRWAWDVKLDQSLMNAMPRTFANQFRIRARGH